MQLSQHSGFRQGAGEFGDQCHASAGHLHARDGARSWRLQSALDAGQRLRSRSAHEASGSSGGIQPVEPEELQQSPDKHEQRGLRPDYRGRARAGVSVRGQVDVLKVKVGRGAVLALFFTGRRSVSPLSSAKTNDGLHSAHAAIGSRRYSFHEAACPPRLEAARRLRTHLQ
jgi:hypothetical protein